MLKTKSYFSSDKLRRTNRNKNWWRNIPILKVNVLLLCLWIVACVAYVATFNDMAVKSHTTKKINNELADLKGGNQDLILSLSDKQSMEQVVEKVKSLGMVPAGSVKYVTMPSTVVVKK